MDAAVARPLRGRLVSSSVPNQRHQRADVFGSPMAGLGGAIETLSLTHSKIPVRVPAERLYHVDGTPREAFVPPFPVEAGTGDAVLDAAVKRLQSENSAARQRS